MAKRDGTKKRLFNSADVILILALLCILCGAVFRRPVESMIADRFSSVEVRYTLTIHGVSQDQADFLKEGDRIYNSDGEDIGRIESVSAEIPAENAADRRVSLVCTVLSPGLSDSSGLYVGQREPMFIAPGKTVEAHSSDYTSFTGIVKKTETVG